MRFFYRYLMPLERTIDNLLSEQRRNRCEPIAQIRQVFAHLDDC